MASARGRGQHESIIRCRAGLEVAGGFYFSLWPSALSLRMPDAQACHGVATCLAEIRWRRKRRRISLEDAQPASIPVCVKSEDWPVSALGDGNLLERFDATKRPLRHARCWI